MSMTVRKRRDTETPRVFMHKVADVRGGVAVNVSELGDDFLAEGAIIGKPDSAGLCHVVKVAVLAADLAAAGTSVNVKKGSHLKVGNVVMADGGDKAVAITAIDKSNKAYDVLTITAIGKIDQGGYLIEASEAKDSGAAMKVEPFAVVGTGKPVIPNTNLDTDAWLIGVTKGNAFPKAVAEKITGIINY